MSCWICLTQMTPNKIANNDKLRNTEFSDPTTVLCTISH
jgi:hypothetical protein